MLLYYSTFRRHVLSINCLDKDAQRLVQCCSKKTERGPGVRQQMSILEYYGGIYTTTVIFKDQIKWCCFRINEMVPICLQMQYDEHDKSNFWACSAQEFTR